MRFILLTLFVCFFCSSCQETELKRRTLGYKGKAKANPFLAAERLLNKEGFDAASAHGFGRLDEQTATLFIPTSSLNTVGRAKRVLEWVASGGHLILMLDGGEMGGNDFVITPSGSYRDSDLAAGVQHLLDEMNVVCHTEDLSSSTSSSKMELDEWEELEEKDRVLLESEESKINLGDGELVLHSWSDKTLEYNIWSGDDYGSGESDKGEHRYLSLRHGSGRVSLLSDARPLRNRYLGYGDHAEFLITLAYLSDSGKIVFSSGEGDGFLAMLWRHFKMAVIGLLAVVLLWLWRHLPRYGPAQDVGEGNTREFTEQLRGIGRFLWRHKRDDSLLGSLRAHINRALSLHAGISDEGIFEQLADKTGLPVESVIEAMTREQVTEPGVMVRVTQNLQKILKHIN